MWKSSIRGVVLGRVEFDTSSSFRADTEETFGRVMATLDDLAWFHRVPVLLLATVTTILCCCRYGKTLDELGQEKRQRFVRGAMKLPLWNLFYRLIGSAALLNYFGAGAGPGRTGLGRPRP
jgi:hypothetical protein